jgi:alpha-glucosidase
MPDGWAALTVAHEATDATSTLAMFRSALRLRAALFAEAGDSVEWLDAPAGVLAYRRGGVVVLLNAGQESALLPAGEVLLTSGPLEDDGLLPVDTAAWVQVASSA